MEAIVLLAAIVISIVSVLFFYRREGRDTMSLPQILLGAGLVDSFRLFERLFENFWIPEDPIFSLMSAEELFSAIQSSSQVSYRGSLRMVLDSSWHIFGDSPPDPSQWQFVSYHGSNDRKNRDDREFDG